MSQLAEHILVKGTVEKKVRLLEHLDPNQSSYVRNHGWKVKTNKTPEFKAVYETNDAIMDAKLNQEEVKNDPPVVEEPKGNASPDENTNPPKSVEQMDESELKKILSDNGIKFGRAKMTTLQAKVTAFLTKE